MKVKVFLSWSGDLSRDVAELLNYWLPQVLQNCEPWISTQDIGKGALWGEELTNSIAAHSFGILCMTPTNLNAPYILFEAGGLSKGLSQNSVSPLLINIEVRDLPSPLALLNATKPTLLEMAKLVKAINKRAPIEAMVQDAKIDKATEKWWPDFEKPLADLLLKYHSTAPKPKDVPAQLTEILDHLRQIRREVQSNNNNNSRSRMMARILGVNEPITQMRELLDQVEAERFPRGFPRVLRGRPSPGEPAPVRPPESPSTP